MLSKYWCFGRSDRPPTQNIDDPEKPIASVFDDLGLNNQLYYTFKPIKTLIHYWNVDVYLIASTRSVFSP